MTDQYERPSRVAEETQENFTLGFIRLLMSALAEKSMLWASLLGAMVAWGWTVFHPDPWTMGASAGYSALIFLPMLLRRR